MQIHEFIDLYFDLDGQKELYEKARAGDNQAILDFVRFSVFKKVMDDDSVQNGNKIKTYLAIMELVDLTVLNKEQ